MKLRSSLFVGLVVGCLCAMPLTRTAAAQAKPAAPAPSTAPTVTGPSKIAIFNIQEAIVTTQEGKKLTDQLNVRFAPRKTELQNDANALAALQKQLADGGNTMSQQAKDELTSEIQTKQRDYQQAAQNAQSDYQNAQTDMMNTVGTKMMAVLKTYAEQHGYTAVVDVSLPWPQSPVLYYNPGTEITAEIIKLYDQAHPVAAAPAKPAGQ